MSTGIYDTWANRYVVGVGWGVAKRIETENASNTNLPQLSMDGRGNVIAVWYQHDGTRNNIWANRYVPGRGWGTAGLIEIRNVGSANLPQISINASGDAVAVWLQSDGSRDRVWANHWLAQ